MSHRRQRRAHGVGHQRLDEHVTAIERRLGEPTSLECLLDRLTDIKLVTDDDPHIWGQPFRSPTALPVTFET